MILVDTSVWIDHLRKDDRGLTDLLNRSLVIAHPLVIGELACGNLRNRSEVITLLKNLPQTPIATHDEVLFFIERHQLMGRGIGYIDAHLLAATTLTDGVRLWTHDKRLIAIADSMDLAYDAARLS